MKAWAGRYGVCGEAEHLDRIIARMRDDNQPFPILLAGSYLLDHADYDPVPRPTSGGRGWAVWEVFAGLRCSLAMRLTGRMA